MAIKSEVNVARVKEKPTYPYLGVYEGNGRIVLFVGKNHGVCVGCLNSRDGKIEVGADDWTFHEGYYKPYEGTVTLQNK